MKCPHCAKQILVKSNDHVFPAFLGGGRTIVTCRECNNRFGHTFEAATAKNLSQLSLMLRSSGIKMPRLIKWKGIPLDDSGDLYNVDSDLNVHLSKPEIVRDESGRILSATGSEEQMRRLSRNLADEGIQSKLVEIPSERTPLRNFKGRLELETSLRRTAIKMANCLAALYGLTEILDARSRRFLLDGTDFGNNPVRLSFAKYDPLEQLRPPAGHLIYLRASPADRRAYAVVQIHTLVQVYCELHSDYSGPSECVYGTLDPVSFRETFGRIAMLNVLFPPRFSLGPFAAASAPRIKMLEDELKTIASDAGLTLTTR